MRPGVIHISGVLTRANPLCLEGHPTLQFVVTEEDPSVALSNTFEMDVWTPPGTELTQDRFEHIVAREADRQTENLALSYISWCDQCLCVVAAVVRAYNSARG